MISGLAVVVDDVLDDANGKGAPLFVLLLLLPLLTEDDVAATLEFVPVDDGIIREDCLRFCSVRILPSSN